MTKNQIIEALFKGKNFNDCIQKMEPDHLREDLKMEVALIVCEWPDEKIIGLHQRRELEFFVVRVILNQIQSESSPFYKKYRQARLVYMEDPISGRTSEENQEARHRHIASVNARVNVAQQVNTDEFEDRLAKETVEDKALSEIENLYWYNAELVKLYMIHGNYRAIEQHTGIPFVSCYHTIKKAFKELKQKAL